MSQTLELRQIKTSELEPNPKQPRLEFDKEKLKELAGSITESGLVEPIIVRKQGAKYQIIAGERRWRAAKLAGINTVPCIVKDVADKKLLLESFIENIQREDLTSVENENVVYELWKSGEFATQKKLADTIGRSLPWVNDLIDTKEFRHEAGIRVPNSTSTSLIAETRGLDLDTRVKLVQMATKEELTQRPAGKVSSAVAVLKKAPAPLRQAFEKGEVKLEDAKKAVTTYESLGRLGLKVSPEKIQQHVEEIKRRRKEEDKHTEITEKSDKEYLSGELDATSVRVTDVGHNIIQSIEDAMWKLKRLSAASYQIVGAKRWKEEVKPMLTEIEQQVRRLQNIEAKALA